VAVEGVVDCSEGGEYIDKPLNYRKRSFVIRSVAGEIASVRRCACDIDVLQVKYVRTSSRLINEKEIDRRKGPCGCIDMRSNNLFVAHNLEYTASKKFHVHVIVIVLIMSDPPRRGARFNPSKERRRRRDLARYAPTMIGHQPNLDFLYPAICSTMPRRCRCQVVSGMLR
jgi:hypothetical protein